MTEHLIISAFVILAFGAGVVLRGAMGYARRAKGKCRLDSTLASPDVQMWRSAGRKRMVLAFLGWWCVWVFPLLVPSEFAERVSHHWFLWTPLVASSAIIGFGWMGGLERIRYGVPQR